MRMIPNAPNHGNRDTTATEPRLACETTASNRVTNFTASRPFRKGTSATMTTFNYFQEGFKGVERRKR